MFKMQMTGEEKKIATVAATCLYARFEFINNFQELMLLMMNPMTKE